MLEENIKTINCLFLLQKKAIRTINFKERWLISSNFLTESKLLTVYWSATSFNNWFTFSWNFHQYKTSFTTKDHFKFPSVKATSFGKGAIINMVTKTWNNILKITKDVLLNSFSPTKLKLFLNIFFSNFNKVPL